jgi:nucleotide-binding universal stress UspA family protein
MRKLLIGVHDKNCSMRAVTYLTRQYPEGRDLEVTVAHVIPDLPAMYWDDGHILGAAEEAERARVIETWVGRQRDYIEPILQGAVRDLVSQGFPAGRVHMKIVLASGGDVADTLLDEAAAGGFQTIVVGRCGIADGKHFMVGSVVSKLIHKAANLAICVVQ